MKILFIGMGSIGKRHLSNIKSYAKKNNIILEVHALRSIVKKEINVDVDLQYYDYEDLPSDYDCCFICNPTFKHHEALKNIFKKCNYIFLEKPVFDHGNYDISFLKEHEFDKVYVAAPLRYNRVIKEVKAILSQQKVYSIRVICSSYLPEWRKNVDYRNVYSSHKAQGGGVSIDCIHEWDYITYIFGFPKKIINIENKVSDLELDCEDVSIYIANYGDKLAEVHLDYFGLSTRREIEVFTKYGFIKGDLVNKAIHILQNNQLEIKNFEYDLNEMYDEEIKYFFEVVCLNKGNQNNIKNAIRVLRLVKELR
jgi:predicted dehydrogenase